MRAGSEAACSKALADTLTKARVNQDDYGDWVSLELGQWQDSGKLSPQLLTAIAIVLRVADPVAGPLLADKWQRIYDKLFTDHFMNHEEIRSFLSHSFLMIDLARKELLSAAQIAKLLSQRDNRVRFSRQNVSDTLNILGYAPIIGQVQIETLFRQDKADELPQFADSDIYTAAEVVALAGRQLGFPGDLANALCTLYVQGEPSTYTPYLQILHYQCCIAEYYDHATTDIYEFSPRGQATLWLIEQYPDSLSSAGNPFLNNAKSVERITDSWVRSKKVAERPGAAMLLEILSGLEAMGFAARRELGRLIRLWLQRVIRLSRPLAILLPATLDHRS
jgi:hypothetical protein